MTEVELSSEMPVRFVDHMGDDLSVAQAAWVSTKGERAQEEGDSEKVAGLINYLMEKRHGSPFEQNAFKFLVEAPIFVWREWHRHRISSYNERSGRYSKLPPKFYVPPPERPLINVGTSARPKGDACRQYPPARRTSLGTG